MNETPLLSVVVTARNDNHGKNFLHRMQIFVTGFLEQARRHNLPSELIIVEWNPPAGRPRLVDTLLWDGADGPCRVRIIEVPPAVHRRYPHADRLPLFQMIAKNVGIRRARGRFVLCTNIDLLFSDALMALCASGRLDPRYMYRVDRLDVPADVPVGVPVAEQLEFCCENVLRVNTRWGTFERGQIPALVLVSRLWQRLGCNGVWAGMRAGVNRRLARSARLAARVARRLPVVIRRLARIRMATAVRSLNRMVRAATGMPFVIARLAQIGSKELARRGGRLVHRLRHGVSGSAGLPSVLARLYREIVRPLHTNACGDFTLLAREQWCALRGYPELPIFSLHLDSVFCQMAYHAGIREVMMGRRCHAYHLDHESGWSPQEAIRLVRRMEDLNVPVVDHQLYNAWIETMRGQRGANIFNGEDWGLERENLPEIEPVDGRQAEWAHPVPRPSAL